MEPADAEGCAQVDAALREWRQGDCVLGEHWFVFRTDIARPLTREGAMAAAQSIDTAESEVFGFMVVTQTCDLVRECSKRPFAEVCPLVEVDVEDAHYREIERGQRPNYVAPPTLRDRRLVADLDRVMTVEKGVIAGWERVRGWHTDGEARRIALSLARKRVRVAYPDDFGEFAKPLKERMLAKHDRNSEEGRAMRALREIRVRAEPSWDADEVTLMFWLVRSDDAKADDAACLGRFQDDWLRRIPPGGRFVAVQAVVAALDDMTARDFVESDPLDLDHLTTRRTGEASP